jgi:hypothetical protein
MHAVATGRWNGAVDASRAYRTCQRVQPWPSYCSAIAAQPRAVAVRTALYSAQPLDGPIAWRALASNVARRSAALGAEPSSPGLREKILVNLEFCAT